MSTAELLQMVEVWRSVDEALRVAKEVRMRVMWEGIRPGDWVELTVEAHVQRGGLLLKDEAGVVRVKQVRIVEIEGNRALVLKVEPYGRSTEWMFRDELGAVVTPGLVRKDFRGSGEKHWEAS